MIATDKEFKKAAREMGKALGIEVRFEKGRGKGSHGTLFFGRRRTTVQKGNLPAGTYRHMCKQIGVKPRDLETYK